MQVHEMQLKGHWNVLLRKLNITWANLNTICTQSKTINRKNVIYSAMLCLAFYFLTVFLSSQFSNVALTSGSCSWCPRMLCLAENKKKGRKPIQLCRCSHSVIWSQFLAASFISFPYFHQAVSSHIASHARCLHPFFLSLKMFLSFDLCTLFKEARHQLMQINKLLKTYKKNWDIGIDYSIFKHLLLYCCIVELYLHLSFPHPAHHHFCC